jgi:hypothetical protein
MVAFHQGFDHLNSPKVPHNGCKGAIKNKTQMKIKVFKIEYRVAFWDWYTLKNLVQNQLPSKGSQMEIKNVSRSICDDRNSYSHCLMATKFSGCCWMATNFSRHMIVVTKNLSITIMFFPSPHPPFFFSLFWFPPP